MHTGLLIPESSNCMASLITESCRAGQLFMLESSGTSHDTLD